MEDNVLVSRRFGLSISMRLRYLLIDLMCRSGKMNLYIVSLADTKDLWSQNDVTKYEGIKTNCDS